MDSGVSLDFYQILYDESQRSELYPFAKPYFSVGITPYFENAFIAGLVPMSTAEYISVCSWRLRKKRGDAVYHLGGLTKDELTADKILTADFDVAILTPHSPSHKPLAMAVNWHGQAWVTAFAILKDFLRNNLGIKVPDELRYAIYENHFIAKGEIYRQYVSTCLIPVIGFMENEGVFETDSGYLSKKKDQTEIKKVQKALKRNDWPIAPFILERLFSIYINDKGYKVINL